MESWMKMLSPLFSLHMPASGDVWMDYRPWTNWGMSSPRVGSPEIESGVFRDVALPGKQLGKLTDAVIALIAIVKNAAPGTLVLNAEQAKVFEDLSILASDVSLKKQELKKSTKAEALEALARLNRADAEAFKSLINDLLAKGDSVLKTDEPEPGQG